MGKKGLVLEGGAMRGMFTAGVMDVMMEADIRFDGIVGVSAGAAFGCNYKSHQNGRAIRYNKRFCNDPRYCSWRTWLKTGDLFGAEFCYHEIPDVLDPFDRETYEKTPAEFWIVCTDILTGEAVYRNCPKADDECFRWMQASASMPLVSNIVSVGGGKYLDGAMADSIPLRFFERSGYDKNIVILTQPAGFVKKPSAAMFLMKLVYRKYPELLRAIAKRHEIYNETVRYVESRAERGAVFVIRPEESLPVKRVTHDPEVLQRTYDAGRAAGKKHLQKILEFLQ